MEPYNKYSPTKVESNPTSPDNADCQIKPIIMNTPNPMRYAFQSRTLLFTMIIKKHIQHGILKTQNDDILCLYHAKTCMVEYVILK